MFRCTSVFATLKPFETSFRHIIKKFILQYAVRSSEYRFPILSEKRIAFFIGQRNI
ncbi:hypothetical protein TREVI0001_2388 [Treponema vincentii ATCC 35580]|uniref:Uncharacterized protein n=1 Tax=Treponema vincentii ATCC 35580 TaxID=596324 RepID=C8PNJ2_9SPIR|nr:hypothetical protein TREVI0001_2388 [Treponema vincentii ATCC 35580]